MPELIVVILIVGILALVFTPKMMDDSDRRLGKVVDEVTQAIRYAQMLGMSTGRGIFTIDRSNPTYRTGGYSVYTYRLSADNFAHPISIDWIRDPVNPSKYLYWPTTYERESSMMNPAKIREIEERENPRMFISKNGIEVKQITYGLDSCFRYGGFYLAFDELGRPFYYSYSFPSPSSRPYFVGLMYKFLDRDKCKFAIESKTKVATISIEPETGFVHVEYSDK